MASRDDPGVPEADMTAGEMQQRDEDRTHPARLVAIGGSAGSIEALQRVVRALPSSFPAAIVVVVHVPTTASSRLPEVLARAGPLPAHHIVHGEHVAPGTIHVAPPDRHVIAMDGRLLLVEGPRENGVRPAIDPLLRSAARTWASDAISVILSGTLDDGTAGTAAVHAAGGITIAQRPSDAICPGMPTSAIDSATVDYVVSADEVADLLVKLVRREDRPRREVREALSERSRSTDLVCPECGGVLRQFAENGVFRFHCRVGHNYSPESLYGAQDARLEAALWAAIRSLEESASLSRRLANDARQRGAERTALRFDDRERDAAERADLIRSAILTLTEYEDTPSIAEAEPVASEDDANRPVAVGDSTAG